MIHSVTPIRLLGLRRVREAKGLSQLALAEEAGVRQATISELESGGAWTSETLGKLARALDVDPAELLRGGEAKAGRKKR